MELFIFCLPQLTNLFFALNHPNYAKWLVKFCDAMPKLDKTHPEVYDDFKNGWLAITRTKKSFSATAVDLTLEHSVNAEAASQHLGITSITNLISARQRWADSHFLRTSIVSSLLDRVGLTKTDDVTAHLKKSKIKVNDKTVCNVMDAIKKQ